MNGCGRSRRKASGRGAKKPPRNMDTPEAVDCPGVFFIPES